ncbi:MAG: hypothetical protein ACREIE_07400, partial [Nitrospiraceae bacterium]
MKVASSISIALLITFASPILALSDEPIAIGEIVADPDLYHLKLVTVQGTVRQVKALAPYVQTSGSTCYGAYTFRLEDDTGAIEIDVLGLCGNPVLKVPDVIEGDRVIVQAQILAPGHSAPHSGSESSPLF